MAFRFRRLFPPLLTLSALGCRGGGGDGTAGTGNGTTDDVGDGDGDGDNDGGGGCSAAYPLDAPYVMSADSPTNEEVAILDHCASPEGLGLVEDDGEQNAFKLQRDLLQPENFFVYIYRPAFASDPDALEWPQERLPVLLFSPGAGQSIIDPMSKQETYRHLFEPLVEDGFIVVAIEPPTITVWPVAKRWRAMFCSLIWLQSPAPGAWSERDNGRMNCDVVLAGHSRGGEAAWTATQLFQPFGDASVVMNTYTLRATVGVAPRSDPAPFADEPSTPISAEEAVPYLGIMGGNDEDVIGHAIRAFDILANEEIGDLSPTPKSLLWVYDVPHNAWGGKSDQDLAGVIEPFKVEKARAILPAFVVPFLRHHVLEHGDPADNFAAMSGAFSATAIAADFPPAVTQPEFWDYLEPEYLELGSRPVILGGYSPGLANDPNGRLLIDTLLRDPTPTDCSAMEQAGALSPATSGGNVTLEGLDPDQVCVGEHSMLSPNNPLHQTHTTSAIRTQWGDGDPGGAIVWEIDTSLADYAHLSLRLGQVWQSGFETGADVTVELRGASLATGDPAIASFSVSPVIKQDTEESTIGFLSLPTDFMHTVRIPLGDFCDSEPLDLTQIDAVAVRVGPSATARQILVDSVEFTRGSPDDEISQCVP